MSTTIYLNTAACGLVSPATTAAAHQLYAEMEHNASTRAEHWRFNEESRIRNTIASFLNVSDKNVAMVPNFSWAINGIVQSLKGSERVLLHSGDYPSFIEPFRINKFDITWADTSDGFHLDMDFIRDCIFNHKVDIVALSHVQWSSGYKVDIMQVGEWCRDNGVLFFVDATQSIGANVIDLSELHIDVFISSNYKWMNAGFGTGEMYITDSFLEKYPPVVGGHNSYKMIDGAMRYVSSAQSYEPGHPNMFGLTVLESAIIRRTEQGVHNVQQHNSRLCQLFLDGIKNLPVNILGDYTTAHRSSIVMLKDDNGLGDWIKQHNIVVTHRNGLLRVSMHYYNTEADINTLIDCLQQKFA
ncbi:MAG: aminotransferase class V-fold PLP-dependent enzyme [Bacteroidetes bacterium]|nr:aminotransferase class V-fold PLP-dependent enzyme [Bacteroidota bacterium]